MSNIILIGMPAVGKSSVGIVVAKRFGYEFVDTDLLIQKQEGKLLKDIIAEEGNERFLEIENQVNRDPVSYTHLDVYKRQGYEGT